MWVYVYTRIRGKVTVESPFYLFRPLGSNLGCQQMLTGPYRCKYFQPRLDWLRICNPQGSTLGGYKHTHIICIYSYRLCSISHREEESPALPRANNMTSEIWLMFAVPVWMSMTFELVYAVRFNWVCVTIVSSGHMQGVLGPALCSLRSDQLWEDRLLVSEATDKQTSRI